jgi:hypothetical protein
VSDASGGRLPDFLIIGAAKAGTTTLHDYLARHPRVRMSRSDDPSVRDKEPCFFDAAVNWKRGVEWYRSLFAGARDDQLCGEASTNYTRFPQVPGVPERIAALLPRAKLLYLLRHPVERAYSHYVHRWTRELHPGEPFRESFEAFVARDPMCLDGSDYALQVRRYLAHFPRASLLLLRTDDLERDPRELLARALAFLGLDDPGDLVGPGALASNPGGVSEAKLRANATRGLRGLALARAAARALPKRVRDSVWELYRRSPWGRRLRAAYSAPPMRPETRAALLERFRPSNRFLREEFGLDTSPWER